MAEQEDPVVQRLDWIIAKLDLILRKLPEDPYATAKVLSDIQKTLAKR